MHTYHFVLATKNFLANEEPIEEILRERTRYYESIKKVIDFWFVVDPTFLEIASIENFHHAANCSYAAIVSSDPQFICWLKLRIGFVTVGSFKSADLFLG